MNRTQVSHSKPPEVLKTLRAVSLFAGLEDGELTHLTSIVKQQRCHKGTLIVTEGYRGDSLYVLERGTAKVTRATEDGREVILAFLREGDFFGELSILDGRERSANVIALEDTEVATIERVDFMHLIQSYPLLSLGLLVKLAQRIRACDQQIEFLALSGAETRVLRALVRMAEDMGVLQNETDIVIAKSPTQQDLSDMAGTSRETVSRSLRSLEKRKLISRAGGSIQLPNFHDLRASF